MEADGQKSQTLKKEIALRTVSPLCSKFWQEIEEVFRLQGETAEDLAPELKKELLNQWWAEYARLN